MEFEKVPCMCGEQARIVECGVGVYIHCPHCNSGTPMQTTKTDAMKYWNEKGNEFMKNRGICNLPLSQIHPHPDNPRKDLGDLSEMTESVRKNGIMQNLTVIPGHWDKDRNWIEDGYTLVIGHRRHAAAKKAELDKVPCRIVEGMTHKEQVSMMLEENMQRNDLTIWEQAQGFQMMLDLGDTEEKIAEKTGFSKSTVHHRLNIAKLDQEIIRTKEKDEFFQLSITDLYALEKIEDIETRNKVLKDASDHRQLVYKAQSAADEEKRQKNLKIIIDELQKQGVKPAPKKAETELYSKWNVVKEIDLREKVPGKITLKGIEQKYYLRWGPVLKIIEKKSKKEEKKSEWELQRDKINANKKLIESKIKQAVEVMEEFTRSIVAGRLHIPKETSSHQTALWELLRDNYATISNDRITGFLLEIKNPWDVKVEDRERTEPQIKTMSMYKQMLCVLMNCCTTVDLVDYNGCYIPEKGRKMMAIYEFIAQYGFTFENEEHLQLINGTHELYAREKQDE